MSETTKRKTGRKKKRVFRRLLGILMILILLGGGGFYAWMSLKKTYTVTYDPYTATTGSISNSLSFSGTMQLISSATYQASASGKVREVYVSVGDKVSEGNKLVRLSNGETISAEFDGTVNRLDVEKGDEVRAGDSLVQVADFDHMQVSIRVGESNITEVAAGQSCRVTVASIGATFESTISAIDYASYSGNNVAYYTTTVDVDTSRVDNIYPGMQATVTIPKEEANDVVILKMDAISTAADNSAFVYKQQADGTMEKAEIAVGVSNGNYVEIREGVESGETVYAVAKAEEESTGLASLFSGMFGGQRVNQPQSRTPGSNGTSQRGNWEGGNGGMPSGGNAPSGGGSTRRGN